MVKFCNNETGHVIPACEGGRHTGLGTRDSAEKCVVLAPDGAVAAKLNLKKGKEPAMAPTSARVTTLDVSSDGRSIVAGILTQAPIRRQGSVLVVS